MSDQHATAHGERRTLTDIVRRDIDILISSTLLLLTLPVMIVTIVGSALALRTSPFFSQVRVGRGGEHFRFVKIRTLPPTTPAYTDKHQLDMHAIPAFCRLIRRLHLDELPQLIHVLSGRMSMVGPRPEMPHLHEGMNPEFAGLRTSVAPGCTGLWQISPACVELIHESPQYDEFYVANRSVRVDLWVMYRTALKMTGLGRHVGLEEIPAWVAPAVSERAPATAESLTAPVTAGR